MFVDALGWAAAVCCAVVALPQVIRLLRATSPAGVSALAWQFTLSANLAWSAHGVLTGHLTIFVPNLVFTVYSTLVLLQLRRMRGAGWAATFGPVLALATVTAGLDVVVGPLAFAVAAFLPSAVSQLVQLRALFLLPDVRAVSLGFLGLNVANQVLWVSWSLLVVEPSITLVGSSLGTLMLLNLVVGLLRRHRLITARLALLHA